MEQVEWTTENEMIEFCKQIQVRKIIENLYNENGTKFIKQS